MAFLISAIGTKHAGANKMEPTRESINRINYGVIFAQDNDLVLSREYWRHTFHVPIPKKFKLSAIPECKGRSDCNMIKLLALQIHALHQEVLGELHETIKSVRSLVPQSKLFGKSRQGRALLPFIGTLSRGLFGLATMDDINVMAGHINAIAASTNKLSAALVQHGKHLSSFMTLTDKRFDNIKKGLKLNSDKINKVTNLFSNKFLQFEHTVINMSDVLIQQVNKANILRSRLNKFENSIQSLVSGKITPHLISRSTLLSIIQQITKTLRKSYSQFQLTHTDPSYYFSHGKFVYARNFSSIYLTVKFPLTAHKRPLTLYKVISLPVPLKENSSSAMHATQLLSLPDYFAITKHHDHFVPIAATDLVNCVHDTEILCDMNLPLTPITIPDCTMALFSNNRDQIKKYCDFRYVPNLVKSNIIELSPTSVLVYNIKNLVLNCPSEQKVIPGCHFCVIHVPCRCSLSSDTLFFSPRLVNCYNSSSTMTRVHPVNLALLQEFFDESKLNSIFGDTTFPTPINLTIPEFQMFNHSFSNIVANDQKMHLSLKRIAKATREDQKVFKSLAEPILDGQIKLEPSWPSNTDIIALVSLSVAALCMVVLAILIFKIRKLSVALLVLQQVQHAKTQTVPSFIYNAVRPTTTESSSVLNFLQEDISWSHLSVIIGIVVIVILVLILALLYKSKSKKCTSITLELTSGGTCVMIPVMELSMCPSYYDIPAPIIRGLSLTSFPGMKLMASWSPFTVTDVRTKTSFVVPNTITLNVFDYVKTKKILNQPYSAYFHVVHHDIAWSLKHEKREISIGN
ncbi:hypothetical protein FSP39_002667 [Pinctada imbricata]|uniref:Envelope fusion protein n=1 Tax=Pinctada imbricata TaxID=66713 RepID=A0AA88Y665_PINIB|nr:hypothetical protein FSP39_002667 [Pinctada imbricata]